jgi:signal transduction histidine kinase
VRLRSSNGVLELEVEDHGAGFKTERLHRGLGLIAMRERAELLGGTVELRRPPQGGTLVKLRVPVAQAAPFV